MSDIPNKKALSENLQEILQQQLFEKLDDYTEPSCWTAFSNEDRILLAKLFMMRADAELKLPASDDPIAFAKKNYTVACQVTPEDRVVWYKRAMALCNQESRASLEEASLCFEKAVCIDKDFFDGWHDWGNLFIRRALILEESSFLTAAEDKFHRAEEILEAHISDKELFSDSKVREFYWQYGFLSFMVARHSEEAVDLNKAVQYYRKAHALGLVDKEFYNDFGNALVELSLKISQEEMIYEAIELYLLSLDDEEACLSQPHMLASRQFNLGSCYHFLFEMHHEEVFFKQAEECFSKAVTYHPIFLPALRHWGNLLLYAAKLWQDVQYLEMADDIFQKAYGIAEEDTVLSIRWSETLCHLGAHEDDLQQLQKAAKLIETALENEPESVDALGVQGLILYSLGRYFEDDEYYIRAQEKLEQALTHNKQSGTLWHYLANIKFTYGQEANDLQFLEESIVCFHWASRGEPGRFGYFWNDWGVALLNIADYTQNPKFVEEAVEKFEQAILCQEQVHPQWLINFGASLDFLGDLTDDEASFEKAIQILSHTAELDPESITARYHLGLAYCHLGELCGDVELLQKAIAELQAVIQIDPEDENGYNDLGLAFLHVADLSAHVTGDVKQSFFDSASANFLQAQSLGSLAVLYNLASLHALQGNNSEAMLYLKKAKASGVLPDAEDIKEDTWLEGLKDCHEFQEFIYVTHQEDMQTEMQDDL